MKLNRIHMAMLAALLGSVALAGCKKKEDAAQAPAAPAETAEAATPAVTATVSVTGIEMGTAADAYGKVTKPMTEFSTKDATIYASALTNTSEPEAVVPGKLGARWTHVDSGRIITEGTEELSFTDEETTAFFMNKPDGWPAGKYKVEISLDGTVVQDREFDIR